MHVQLNGSLGSGVSRLEVIEAPTGRGRRTKAERARIAVESLMPGVRVADVARKHGTTRRQVCEWHRQLREGRLVLPESAAALLVFADLVLQDTTPDVGSQSSACAAIKIEVGGVVISAGGDAEEDHLVRVVRAARAADRTRRDDRLPAATASHAGHSEAPQEPITERMLRRVLASLCWEDQRAAWAEVQPGERSNIAIG